MSDIGHNGGPVPVDVDVPDMAYVKFYPGDFLNGTAHMSLEMRGAYITTLCVMYDRMGGFPYDEREGGVLLRVDKRVYRRVRDALLADGKFYRDGGLIRNARVEREISTYVTEYIRRSEAAQKREAERRARQTSAELGPNFDRTSAELGPEVRDKSVELAAKNSTITTKQEAQGDHIPESRSQNPEARIKKESPLPPKGGSDDMPAHVRQVVDWNAALVSETMEPHAAGVVLDEDGGVRLQNGTRQTWLERFGGDEEALSLALVEAAGRLQPNSRKPLKYQIESQLARMVRDTRDRDKRYAKAVEDRATRAPAPRRGNAVLDMCRDALSGGRDEPRSIKTITGTWKEI